VKITLMILVVGKQGGVNLVNKEVAGLTKRLNFPFGGLV
jgi:hypothetical protein